MMRTFQIAPFFVSTLAVLVATTCSLPASGQNRPQQYANAKKKFIAQRAESGGTGEGAWQLLKQPMELPDVPRYTGSGTQFIEGLMYPNKPGGAAISLVFRAKEAPDVVSGWYSDALANYQWKLIESKDASVIKGVHGQNNVTITVAPAKARGFRTEFRINYKLSRK